MGDVGEPGPACGGDTLDADGEAMAVVWDRANGDGVYFRAWWIRAVRAAARAAIGLGREFGGDSAVDGWVSVAPWL